MSEPSFWEALWALISSPFVATVLIILIGVIIAVSIIDRRNQK